MFGPTQAQLIRFARQHDSVITITAHDDESITVEGRAVYPGGKEIPTFDRVRTMSELRDVLGY